MMDLKIELAPGHKQGLPVASPVIVAGGMVGYGETLPRGLAPEKLGALVVGPILGRSRAGAAQPRLAETVGGMVLDTGLQNRGAASVLGKFAKLWPRLGCPVVAQVADGEPRGPAYLADRMAGLPGLSGFELLPLTDEIALVQRMVRGLAERSDLPVWVKLPLASAAAWAAPLVDAGANGLVVAQPPLGRLTRGTGSTQVRGALYGPGVLPLMLEGLAAVAEQGLPCALLACGGIHTAAQAQQALALGAHAIQLDTVVWVEPAAAGWIAEALAQTARAA
ncbi:MAG: hypothetical protein IT329_05035 [Caldilineaceae bacterium]|nr:hypothetical protein [Caldilineaceae bacterium]